MAVSFLADGIFYSNILIAVRNFKEILESWAIIDYLPDLGVHI
jgi:hypothetical protein